jgi:hypothetical protein
MRVAVVIVGLGLLVASCSKSPRTTTASQPGPAPAMISATSPARTATPSTAMSTRVPEARRPAARDARGPVAHPKIGQVVEIVLVNPLNHKTVSVVQRAEVAAFLKLLTTGKGGSCGCKTQYVMKFTLADGKTREAWAMAHGWKLAGPGPKFDGRVIARIEQLFRR